MADEQDSPISEAEYDELSKKSKRGIKWQGITEIVTRSLQFAITIILARLLQPDDFGLITVALLFTQFAYVVFDLGLSAALIQKKEILPIHYSTTFLMNLIMAAIWGTVIYLSAGYIAGFFKLPVLNRILKLLLLIFPLYAFSAIPLTRLMRAIRFRRIGLLQMSSTIAYGMVAVYLAFNGYGVLSFVYAILAENIVLALLYNIFSPWKPNIQFRYHTLKELIAFGGMVMNSRLLSFVNNKIPTIAFGRWLGAGPLGVYSLVYQLVEFPVQRISKNILKVIFPALSQIQDDADNYKNMLLSAIYYLGLVVIPVFAGMALIAPEFIRLVYGPKWLAAIVPLQILAVVGLLRSFWMMNSAIFLSRGKPVLEFKLNILFFLLIILFMVFAFPYGLNMLLLALAAVWWIVFFLGLNQALQLASIPFLLYLKKLRIAGLATVLFLAVNLFWSLLIPGISGWALLSLKIISSVLIYFISIRLFDPQIFKKFMAFSRS